MSVGGIEVTREQAEQALACLRAAPGLMIRQPLARLGSPLAACDYHAVSAPHRAQFSGQGPAGRGAAGRPIAKEAFCHALEQLLGEAAVKAQLGQMLSDALSAFAGDHSYVSAIARAAVAVQVKRHRAALADWLRQASHQAVSACEARRGEFTCSVTQACGSGDCRFAYGDLALIESSAPGKQRRPGNHVSVQGFDCQAGLAELEELRPFQVSVPVQDGDAAGAADAVAAT